MNLAHKRLSIDVAIGGYILNICGTDEADKWVEERYVHTSIDALIAHLRDYM